MTQVTHILFCEDPLEKNKVDPDFAEEKAAAETAGFSTLLFNFELLESEKNAEKVLRKISPAEQTVNVIYRGWMLKPELYAELYSVLLSKNYQLINNPEEYKVCHYLPYSLPYIQNLTSETVFENFNNENALNNLIVQTEKFGNSAVIIKDFVKSEKHDWENACFVPDASDKTNLERIIKNFLDLRGKYLNEGVVVRKFEILQQLTKHSKSGMPLAEEYRLFFLHNQLTGCYDYWEEGSYQNTKPATAIFEECASKIPSNFFTMDIAKKENGEWIIMELGDGQVSGLPDSLNKEEFYIKLRSFIN